MSKDPANGYAHADERVIKEENGEFSISSASGMEGIVEAMLNTHIGTLRNYLAHVLQCYDQGLRTGVAEVIALTSAQGIVEKAIQRLGGGIITREADIGIALLKEAAAVIYEIIMQADANACSTDDLETECQIAFKALRKALRKFPVRFVQSYLFNIADEKTMEKERLETELIRLRTMLHIPNLVRGASDTETRITVAEVRFADASSMLAEAQLLLRELEAKCNVDEYEGIVLLKDACVSASLIHRLAVIMFEVSGFIGDYDMDV